MIRHYNLSHYNQEQCNNFPYNHPFQHHLMEILASAKTRIGDIRYADWEGRHTTVCHWHNLLYRKSARIKKYPLLELIHSYSKFTGYKVNI